MFKRFDGIDLYDRSIETVNYVKEEWKLTLYAFLVGFGISLFMLSDLWVANLYNKFNCYKAWRSSSYESRYDLYSGCMVSKDGVSYTPERFVREI